MAKIEKTADELRDIIFDRVGIKATVRVHATRGWIAIPYTSNQSNLADLTELDRFLVELRGKYALKPE
jgi:hypothetical protein